MLATLILAGCGGDEPPEPPRVVAGATWRAEVPRSWELERPPRTVVAASPDGPEAVSVATFRLGRRFEPELWPAAVRELNDVAARLAERLGPTGAVERTEDSTVGPHRARTYEIAYERDGVLLTDRVTFVLRGLEQYQLTCRIAVDDPGPGVEACERLLGSFRLLPP